MIKNFLTFLPLSSIISTLNRDTNQIFGRKIMTDLMTAKVSPNYDSSMLTTMEEEYTLEPTRETVNSLADRFEKSPRSIISKLVAMGIYQRVENATKRGEPVVRKDVIVAQVNDRLGRELPSISKMTKVDLENLLEILG
jgi:hypothetical protein